MEIRMNTHVIKTVLRYSLVIIITGFAAIGIYKTFFDGTSRALQEAEQAAHYQNVKLDDIKTVKPGDTFEIITSYGLPSPEYQKEELLQLSYDKNIFKLTSEKYSVEDEHGNVWIGGGEIRLTFNVNKDFIEDPENHDGIHAIILWHTNPEFLYETVGIDKDKNSGRYILKIPHPRYEVFGIKIVKPDMKNN